MQALIQLICDILFFAILQRQINKIVIKSVSVIAYQNI
jgi:hypothetical protein